MLSDSEVSTYFLSFNNSLYKNEQDFLDKQYVLFEQGDSESEPGLDGLDNKVEIRDNVHHVYFVSGWKGQAEWLTDV